MKACVLYGNEDIRYTEAPTPKVTEGHVLVKVRAAGICGSDVPRVLKNGAHSYPIILGHEFSGEVAKVGKGVTKVAEKDRVAGVPLVPCMKCADCANGNYSLCKYYTFIGSRVDGGFAEYVLMPESNVIKFSKSVAFETAAFFEPSTVALHGLFCNDYKAGGNVAVLGGGTIGMFTMQWAKLLGAKSVTVFDINDGKLALAKGLGCEYTVNTLTENVSEKTALYTGGRGYDYVFETAGSTVTMKLAFAAAGNKAKVCFVGTPVNDLCFTPKEFENLNRKEFTLTGSWMSFSAPFPGKEWTMTAEYFSDGRLKILDSYIFRKFGFENVSEAFALFKDPKNVNGKVLLINTK